MEMRSTYDTRKIEIHCRRMGQNIAAEPKPVQLQNLNRYKKKDWATWNSIEEHVENAQ